MGADGSSHWNPLWEKEANPNTPRYRGRTPLWAYQEDEEAQTYNHTEQLLAPTNGEQMDTEEQMDEGLDTRYYDTPVEEEEESIVTEECIGVLKKIANNSREEWPEKLHTLIDWEIEEAATTIHQLSKCTMLCYFTDRTPLLPNFRLWVLNAPAAKVVVYQLPFSCGHNLNDQLA